MSAAIEEETAPEVNPSSLSKYCLIVPSNPGPTI